jgi:hypothetical protein
VASIDWINCCRLEVFRSRGCRNDILAVVVGVKPAEILPNQKPVIDMAFSQIRLKEDRYLVNWQLIMHSLSLSLVSRWQVSCDWPRLPQTAARFGLSTPAPRKSK